MAMTPLAQPDIRNAMIAQMLREGTSSAPVQSWTQGASRLANALVGSLDARQQEQEGREAPAELFKIWQGGQGQMPSQHPLGPVEAGPRPASAPPAYAPPANSPAGRVGTAFAALQPQAQPNPSDPRGIRNNNQLNIEAGRFTQSQPGYAGSDGRFARFSEPQQGIDAASNLLDVYGRKHGINTVAGIINRWAPSSDGNPVNAYASHVAKAVGVGPNDPINMSDPAVRQKLVMAMGQFENGRPIQVASNGPVAMPQGGAPMPQGAPQAAPQQMAQAPNVQMIQQMINHPNPRVRAMGTQMMQQQMTQEPKYMVVGDKLVEISNRQVRTVADADKPPAGYERVDPKDPTKGLRAIPGGPATHVPAEAAGRIAMMDTSMRDLPSARETLMKGRGELGLGTLGARAQSLANIGEIGQANRTVRLGVEAALRVMTGAAAPEAEVKRYMDLFMPSQNDNPATAKQKLDNLEKFMTDARSNVMQGRTATPQAQPSGSVRKFNPATGRIE